jgi:hypothetical protein
MGSGFGQLFDSLLFAAQDLRPPFSDMIHSDPPAFGRIFINIIVSLKISSE